MNYSLINSLFLIFLSQCTVSLNGQRLDSCEYNKIYKVALEQKSPDTINQVLENAEIILSEKDKAELFSYRALLTSKLNKSERRNNRILKDSILNDSNKSTSFLKEKDNLRYLLRRNTIRNKYLRLRSIDNDLKILKHYGYKEEKKGIGLRLKLRLDQNLWGGFEVALWSAISPKHKIKIDSSIIHNKRMTKAMSVFVIGYSKSITDIQQEYTFSLLKFEAPLYLDITQFGILDNQSEERYFYRPEIGIEKWGFTLTYGYNAFLNKGKRYRPDKHIANLRYLHTFNKKLKSN